MEPPTVRSPSLGTLVTSQGVGMQLHPWPHAVAKWSPWGHGSTKARVLHEPSPMPSCSLYPGEHMVSRRSTNAHVEKEQMPVAVGGGLTLVGCQVPTQLLAHRQDGEKIR